MFCRKCGKELVAGDNFCPNCGEKVNEIDRSEIGAYDSFSQEPKAAEAAKTKFDFNWETDDFRHEKKPMEEAFDWGDMFGAASAAKKKKPEAVNKSKANAESGEESNAPRKTAAESSEEYETIDKFHTFNKKNEEFQQLLNKEYTKMKTSGERMKEVFRETVDADEIEETSAEESQEPQVTEEAPAEFEKVIEEHEETIDVAEPETEATEATEEIETEEAAVAEEAAETAVEEDQADSVDAESTEELGGEPPKGTAEAKKTRIIPKSSLKAETEKYDWDSIKEDDQLEEMAKARSMFFQEGDDKANTRKISKDEISKFMKEAEKNLGIEDPDSDTEGETAEKLSRNTAEIDIPEVKPEEAESKEKLEEERDVSENEVAEGAAENPSIKLPRKSTDFNFSERDEDREAGEIEHEKKRGKAGNKIIAILAIIMAVEIAAFIIRYNFPDSGIAHTIEPFFAKIEEWLGGLF